MAYQAKYWNGSAWVAVANASFDTSGLVKTTGNTGTVDLSGAPVVKGAGMDLIVPTSVTGGTFSASGAITFSAVSAVSINGCFTSAYDNYRIMISGVCSDFSGLDSRLRLSGTDSSVSYTGQTLRASSTTVSAAAGPTNAANIGAIHTTQSIITVELAGPAKAQQTAMYAIAGLGAPRIDHCAAFHTAATAYDGITILPDVATSGRTITGTLRIYGYHN